MRQFVAQKVVDLPPSGIRAFFDLVAGREDIVSLGVGEPDSVTPWSVREAGIYSLEQGRTAYTSNAGLLELRQAISGYQKGLIGNEYDPKSEILITVGVSQGLDLALRAILDNGDEVIHLAPCYVSYGPMIQLAGGIPVPVRFQGEAFEADLEAIRAAITPRTKAILLCSPNNPTGTVLNPAALKALSELCLEHDLLAISDEIYAELVYEDSHRSIASQPGMRERTVVLNGVSKSQSMTGWRIGYACGPASVIAGMLKIHQYSMLCAPVTGQIAAREALEHGAQTIVETRREYSRRRHFIVSALREIGLSIHPPGGAFYAFPSIRATGLDSLTFCQRLLEEGKVAAVPGAAFGQVGEGHIRCAFATGMNDLRVAMQRMGDFVAKLGGKA